MKWKLQPVAASVLSILAAGNLSAQNADKQQIDQMVLEGVPAVDKEVEARMKQYLDVRPMSLSDISADGKTLLISTRAGNTAQLHTLGAPLGALKQITSYEEPVAGGGFLPGTANGRVLLSKDIGGNENYQLYDLNLADGQAKMLTDGTHRHEGGTVSKSGKWLAFSGNDRNKKDMDVYIKDLTSSDAPRLLLQVEGSWSASEFSPDEKRLLVQEYISERETHWFVVDCEHGEKEPLTDAKSDAWYGDGRWTKDGTGIYLTSDRDGEFRKLYRIDKTHNWKCLTTDINWDVETVAVDPKSGELAFTVNEDGMSKLYLTDDLGSARKPVTGLPPGVISGLKFNENGGVLAFTFDSATSPADAYTLNTIDGKLTRWTKSEVGTLDPKNFITPRLVRFPTFDQVDGKPREIPAFVFAGKGEGKRPVVIMTHGGPEGQYTPTFSSLYQYWATELGLTVICPNVRGSTGYGRSYHQLDNSVKREDSVKDIGALLDWIGQQPDMDAARVGIFGGSYGGYMVLGSLTNYPERFKAGIDIVGIANFITFLEHTEAYRRDLRRAEYGDERVPEVRAVLEKISPANNADKIKAALFVLHGQNDPRVPVSEAEQIVAKMRELKRPVWFAKALNEGHGFRKKNNRDLSNVLYAQFWQQYLLK